MCSANSTNVTTTSTGTVRLNINVSDGHVIFVPDHDHSAKNGKKKYAVFFGKGDEEHQVIEQNDVDEGVQLKLPSSERKFTALLSAATSGTKVEITIPKGSDDRTITGITVPAK